MLVACGWFSEPSNYGMHGHPMHAPTFPPPADLQCGKGKRSSACYVEVPGGSFLMGAQSTDPTAPGYDPDAEAHEAPAHQVTLSTFWIQQGEVSTSEYMLCVENEWCSADEVTTGGYSNYGNERRRQHPINGITWKGAQRYCEFWGGTLPTEAQWEFAARGSDGRRFPWGNKRFCGVMDVSGGGDDGVEETECLIDGTQPLGRLRGRSPFGLNGMGGSVWEWTADWYASDAYSSHGKSDPTGPETGTRRVQRGGGWSSTDPLELRSAARGSLPPDDKVNDVGFRCVRSR